MYIIDNCMIVNPDGVTKDACIHVDHARIAYAGSKAGAPACGPCETIDAKGRIAMPALMNAHAHSAMVLFRGAADDMDLHTWLNERIWPLESKLDNDSVYWGSKLAIAEMIRGGTVGFNDMYFMTDQTVQAVEETGVSALLTQCLTCASDDKAETDAEMKKGIAFYERFNGAADGRITATFSPHAEYTCSPTLLRKVGEEAKKRNAIVHVHVSETEFEHKGSLERHGKTPIALLHSLGVLDNPTLCAHCVYISDEDMDIMAQTGATVLHCPGSNLKLGSGFARVPMMQQKGVNIALATDGAASNNNLSMFEEMQLAATIHKAVTGDATAVQAGEALAMATANAANAFSWDSGRIEKGKLADIVLLNTQQPHMQPMHDQVNNVIYSAQFEDVYMTISRGKVLYKGGDYFTLDIEEVLANVERIRTQLV